ncbi:hypothetical protein BVG81_009925 [Haliangium sp. UPWRP_2]|nr:hypothetical protein BVG81_009925 [Haliangium sp. UPWRP_2]
MIGGHQEVSLRDADHVDLYETVHIPSEGYIISSKGCLIGQTMEYMKIPNTYGAILAQRSSLMRLGIQVTSSWINPGYAGNLPVLITNTTERPVRIFSGIPFCQLVLLRLSGRPDVTYAEKADAKYHAERQFHPSQVGQDAKRWIAPSVKLAKPEQAIQLETELLNTELANDKVR